MTTELTGLRRINENTLNNLLDRVPKSLVENLLRRKLPTQSKTRSSVGRNKTIPPTIGRIIKLLGLLDIDNVDARARMFIGYLKSKNVSYNTVVRYFNIARNSGLFTIDEQTASIQPDPTAFGGKLHTRILSVSNYAKLYTHLTENWSEYTAPLLVAFHTGLRSMEIIQFTAYTLHQLKSRHVYVNIKRKQTIVGSEPPFWKPVYTNNLMQFVDKLIDLYNDAYTTYHEHSTNVPLFYITPQTLVNRLRTSFYQALGYLPPHGFGIHTCRYMMAQLLASTSKNIVAIQTFLQHKSIKTTQRYLQSDFDYTIKAFNRITKGPFKELQDNLKPPQLLLLQDPSTDSE